MDAVTGTTPTSEALAGIGLLLGAINHQARETACDLERLHLLKEAVQVAGRCTALAQQLAAEAATTEAAEHAHGTGLATWLTDATRLTRRETGALLYAGRDLQPFDAPKAATLKGAVLPQQARAITRVPVRPPRRPPRHHRPRRRTLDDRLRPAVHLHRVGRSVPPALEALAPEVAEASEAERVERDYQSAVRNRFLQFTPDGHGTTDLRGSLPSVDAELLIRLVDAHAAQHKRALEALDPNQPIPSRGPRRADGPMALAHAHSQHALAPGNGGDRPRVVVLIDYDKLHKQCLDAHLLPTGEPVPPSVLRKLACDAEVLPAILNGESEPLDVGRAQRLVIAPIRAALDIRDRGCALPGCDQPPADCHAHHITPWWAGGETSLANLVLVCPHHHNIVEPARQSTTHRWEIRLRPDGLPEVPPPDYVDRARRPRQHTATSANRPRLTAPDDNPDRTINAGRGARAYARQPSAHVVPGERRDLRTTSCHHHIRRSRSKPGMTTRARTTTADRAPRAETWLSYRGRGGTMDAGGASMKILIVGTAGRDFHVFNTIYRGDVMHTVVAFTAGDLAPGAQGRYPACLTGARYPDGIPILPEAELAQIIAEHGVDIVVFAYSEIGCGDIASLAARVLAAGADFHLANPRRSMLASTKPVIAVTAARSGAGKSPAVRYLAELLTSWGRTVAVVRHPLRVQSFLPDREHSVATLDDLVVDACAAPTREPFESVAGATVFSGLDFRAILDAAQAEADVILWDGAGSDLPFVEPTLHIVVTDPLRADDASDYFPGEVGLRLADAVLVSKCDTASTDQIALVERALRRVNPEAVLLTADSPVLVEDAANVTGRTVVVVEEELTLSLGDLRPGAGIAAAHQAGVAGIISPLPQAVGALVAVYNRPPRGTVDPAGDGVRAGTSSPTSRPRSKPPRAMR